MPSPIRSSNQPPEAEVPCSVILPFSDDEEVLGKQIVRIATHLRNLGVRFELLAVDEGSGDNSDFVLTMVHKQVPELALVTGASEGRGFARGAEVARGRTLLLCDPACDMPLASIALSLKRIDAGADAVVFPGRLVVAKRAKTWTLLTKLKGRMPPFSRRFSRSARAAGLHVEAPRKVVGSDSTLGIPERAELQRLANLGPRAVFARIQNAFALARG